MCSRHILGSIKRSMRFNTGPCLVVEKKSKKYRKYCITVSKLCQNDRIQTPQKTNTLDSECISVMMNF